MNKKSLPTRVSRTTTRAAAGGMALLLAFIALMFLRNGNGGSDGSSAESGEGEDSDPRSVVMAAVDSDDATNPATPADTPGGLSAEEKLALSDHVLTVLIDGHNYRIRIPRDPDPVYREATLTRVIELAEAATGDTNGLRVRIERRVTAMAKAEEELLAGLAEHGIRTDAVYMAHDLLP